MYKKNKRKKYKQIIYIIYAYRAKTGDKITINTIKQFSPTRTRWAPLLITHDTVLIINDKKNKTSMALVFGQSIHCAVYC